MLFFGFSIPFFLKHEKNADALQISILLCTIV